MFKKIFVLILVTLIGGGFLQTTSASITSWQKGVSMEPRWNTDFGSDSFKQSVDNLATTHANYVSLIIPYYQSNIYSTDIQPGWNTPTDASLVSGIQYIHSKGMQVMLVVHLESYDSQWRATINPGDRATWYANYLNMLKRLATIAQQQGVESFCIGVELIDMASQYQNADNVNQWDNIIGQLRSMYNGKLTYGANWGGGGWYDEKANIAFWDKLDFIGISAYFNLNTSSDVNSLEGALGTVKNNENKPLSQSLGKKINFTVMGHKSVSGSQYQPRNYNWSGAIDQNGQANDYTALFDYWNGQSFFGGVHLWEWSTDPNAGGAGDGTYTPQGKTAQNVMTQWFGTIPTPTPTPTLTPTPTPSPSSGIEIWWPTNGVHVSGVQPLKTMLQNWSVSQYNMYWQVDGDHLNPMYTNNTDYPHKEVGVDFTGWTWKGNGPYTINFVAKDLTGGTIGQRSIQIFTP